MLKAVNLVNELDKQKNKQFSEQEVLNFYKSLLRNNDIDRKETRNKLQSLNTIFKNNFDFDKLNTDRIYHIDAIKKICIDYRLRFLDSQFFKDQYPEEAITKIHELEKLHNTDLDGFKVVAPIDVFKLRKADDPLLFAPIGNGYFYLIHKWGNDIHPLRKLKFWAFKNVENLLFAMLFVSIICTAITYPFFISKNTNFGYLLMLCMFYFKGVAGMFFIFFGSSGKNFSEYSWQSQYDKIH